MHLEEILFSGSINSEHLKTSSETDEKGGFQTDEVDPRPLVKPMVPKLCAEVPRATSADS